MRISDWSSDVCSSDLHANDAHNNAANSDCEHCANRSEEHTSELQSLMRISYAVFCLKKKTPDTSNERAKYSANTPAQDASTVNLQNTHAPRCSDMWNPHLTLHQ